MSVTRVLRLTAWLLVPIALMPVAFVATFLLLPLWSWIERVHGIESVGHSGPADWCFWVVYATLNVVVAAAVLTRRRASRSPRVL